MQVSMDLCSCLDNCRTISCCVRYQQSQTVNDHNSVQGYRNKCSSVRIRDTVLEQPMERRETIVRASSAGLRTEESKRDLRRERFAIVRVYFPV